MHIEKHINITDIRIIHGWRIINFNSMVLIFNRALSLYGNSPILDTQWSFVITNYDTCKIVLNISALDEKHPKYTGYSDSLNTLTAVSRSRYTEIISVYKKKTEWCSTYKNMVSGGNHFKQFSSLHTNTYHSSFQAVFNVFSLPPNVLISHFHRKVCWLLSNHTFLHLFIITIHHFCRDCDINN